MNTRGDMRPPLTPLRDMRPPLTPFKEVRGSPIIIYTCIIHPLTTMDAARKRIEQGVAIFNQGRPGSQVNRVIDRVSGPQGLNMSGPNNHRNDLGYRAGNAIAGAIGSLR